MPNKVEKRITEQSSLYEHLEKMSVEELTAHINAENKKVAVAIEHALPAINQLISAIEGQLKKGGRLFYAGCGTGGRLATLDTIEVQNTYGIDGSQIQAIFPGGIGCLTQTRESREDDLENGWHQLCDKHISRQDFVLGFSASGTTPFVLAILKHCKEEGIPTGCIVNNPHAPIAQAADYPVEVITGPEFVTGSTRMKAGSSQKMILDMISTSLQIRQGRVEGNKMPDCSVSGGVQVIHVPNSTLPTRLSGRLATPLTTGLSTVKQRYCSSMPRLMLSWVHVPRMFLTRPSTSFVTV